MSHRLIEKVLVGELPDLSNELVEVDNKVQENQAAKNSRVGHDFLPLGQDDQQECCQVYESVLLAVLVCPVSYVSLINLSFPCTSLLCTLTYVQLRSSLFGWISDAVQPETCPVTSKVAQIEIQSKKTESNSP